MRPPRGRHDPLAEGVWDPEKLEEAAARPVQWLLVGSGTYKPMTQTRLSFPPGAYSVTIDLNDKQPIFTRKDLAVDDLMKFNGSISDQILEEIKNFWAKEASFKKAGFLHRRGYLLYGPQGTGKSSTVQQIMADVVARGGVVLICGNTHFFTTGLAAFRQVEPSRPVVCVFEDIDAIIKRYGEDELLAILDGANQIDRVLNIATTNYPEILDKRIVSRPRRFDRVIKIAVPDDTIRTVFLKSKLPKGQNFKKWFTATKGLSFAGLSEALISVLCLGNDLEDTVKILNDIEHGHPSSDDFGKGIGFNADDEDPDTDLSADVLGDDD